MTTTTAPEAPGGLVEVVVEATELTPQVVVTSGEGRLEVAWEHPAAVLFQVRYRAVGERRWVWRSPTSEAGAVLRGLANGVEHMLEVRGYFGGVWQPWTTTIIATPGAADSTPTTTEPEVTTTTEPEVTTTTEPEVTTTTEPEVTTTTEPEVTTTTEPEVTTTTEPEVTTTTEPEVTTTTEPEVTTTTEPEVTTTTEPEAPGGLVEVVVEATELTPQVVVTSGEGRLEVAWEHPAAVLFQVRYRAVGERRWVWRSPTSEAGAVLRGLANGVEHMLEVRGYFGGVWQPWTTTIIATPGAADSTPTTTAPEVTTTTVPEEVTTPTTAPVAEPDGAGATTVTVAGTATTPELTVTAGARRLDVVWSHPRALLYQVRWRPATAWRRSYTSPTDGSGTTLSGLVDGIEHRIEVRAYFDGAWQQWSETAVATPGAGAP